MTEPTPTSPPISSDLAETLASMHEAVPEWDADEVWYRIRDAERDYGARQALQVTSEKVLTAAKGFEGLSQSGLEALATEILSIDPRQAEMDAVYTAYLSALHAAITKYPYVPRGPALQHAAAALAALDVANAGDGHLGPRTRKGVYEAAVKLVRS